MPRGPGGESEALGAGRDPGTAGASEDREEQTGEAGVKTEEHSSEPRGPGPQALRGGQSRPPGPALGHWEKRQLHEGPGTCVGWMKGAVSGRNGGHAGLPNSSSRFFPGRRQGGACPAGGVRTVTLSPRGCGRRRDPHVPRHGLVCRACDAVGPLPPDPLSADSPRVQPRCPRRAPSRPTRGSFAGSGERLARGMLQDRSGHGSQTQASPGGRRLPRRSPASGLGAWRKRAVGPPRAEAPAEHARSASAPQTARGRPAPRGRAGRWPPCRWGRWERASWRGVLPAELGCQWEQLGGWEGKANRTGLRCGPQVRTGQAPGTSCRKSSQGQYGRPGGS